MNSHPAVTRVVKSGTSQTPFLLFFGSRKHLENETEPLFNVLTVILLTLAATVLGICIYAFITGKLG